MSELLDSGTRREFESGAVRDCAEGKGRCDLLPLDALKRYMILHSVDSKDPKSALLTTIIDMLAEFVDSDNVEHQITTINCILHTFCSNIYSDVYTMILEVAIHFEDGARKYGEWNWQKGLPIMCYIDSGLRHLLKHLRGDTDEPHDRAFVWNMLCLEWTLLHQE